MLTFLIRTLNHRFILTIHEINNDRFISFQVSLPTLFGNNVVRTSIIIFSLSIWFVDNSVQIFMKSIKKISDQFSWIMLIVTWKHGLKLCNTLFEMSWWEWSLLSKPEMLYHFCILIRKLSLSSQRICLVDMFQILSRQEIFSQKFDMRQTLQSWVHETSISQISQPRKSFFRILIHS